MSNTTIVSLALVILGFVLVIGGFLFAQITKAPDFKKRSTRGILLGVILLLAGIVIYAIQSFRDMLVVFFISAAAVILAVALLIVLGVLPWPRGTDIKEE